jgi:hypothetical protein
VGERCEGCGARQACATRHANTTVLYRQNALLLALVQSSSPVCTCIIKTTNCKKTASSGCAHNKGLGFENVVTGKLRRLTVESSTLTVAEKLGLQLICPGSQK